MPDTTAETVVVVSSWQKAQDMIDTMYAKNIISHAEMIANDVERQGISVIFKCLNAMKASLDKEIALYVSTHSATA